MDTGSSNRGSFEMSQFLSYEQIKLVITVNLWKTLSMGNNSDIGYVLEVDLREGSNCVHELSRDRKDTSFGLYWLDGTNKTQTLV